jgi:hypothetical protein
MKKLALLLVLVSVGLVYARPSPSAYISCVDVEEDGVAWGNDALTGTVTVSNMPPTESGSGLYSWYVEVYLYYWNEEEQSYLVPVDSTAVYPVICEANKTVNWSGLTCPNPAAIDSPIDAKLRSRVFYSIIIGYDGQTPIWQNNDFWADDIDFIVYRTQ